MNSVERLYEQLRGIGLAPWLDTEDIIPGTKWRPAIEAAIREAPFFAACLSLPSAR